MLKTVSSITNAIGAVNYKGTWNASTNSPNLAASSPQKGDYYVVSTAGTTSLGGITQWGVGDWAIYNGAAWQKVDGGTTGDFTQVSVASATGTNPVADFTNQSVTGNVTAISTSLNSNGNNTNSYHLRSVTQGVGFFYLYGNGTSSFTSDARFKKNIQTTRDGYLEDLMKLRVVKYHWHTQENNEPKELGLIAQEVGEVFPGLIQDADASFDGVTPKVLKASIIPFILLKAIQEMKLEIDSLKSEIQTLKGV
jgi:hypothetical protein